MAYPYYPQQPYPQMPYNQANYNAYSPQPMMEPMTVNRGQTGLLGRAVSSVEEAKAVPSDLNGNPMYFPDLAHNAIHMKVFNPQTGAGDFYTFQLNRGETSTASRPMSAAKQVKYALADDVEAIRTEVAGIRDDMNRMMFSNQEAVTDD